MMLAFLCLVAAVTDGDTLRCADGTRIRLHAIDAPELGHCRKGRACAPGNPHQSKAALAKLAYGKQIQCRPTGKSYERITAFCKVGGVDLSCAQYRGGYAVRLEKYDRQRMLCRTS